MNIANEYSLIGVRGLGFKFFYLFKIYKVLHVFDKYNNYKKKYNNKK